MDLSKLVRDIKDSVRGGNTAPEFVVDLAAEHAEACEILNARLANLRRLLAGGFRSEAISLAEQTPRVLDQVEQLDFPEQDEWIDLLVEKGLDLPAKIDSDAAEMVEDAYDDLRRLESLLIKHRLLALSGSPLSARLQILRKLRENDPLNPLWPQDIERLETARLQQIRAEYQRARTQEDTATLRSLQTELEGDWSGSQARELLARLSKTTAELSRDQARQEMEELTPELNAALAAFDLDQGKSLRERWKSLASVARLPEGHPLLQSASESLAWLAEEDLLAAEQESFDKAIAAMERSIEDRCSLDDLEKQIYELQKFERELPGPLVQRIQLYRDNLYLSRRRRTIAIGTAVVTAVVIATVGVISWVLNQQHRAAVDDAIARLGELDQDYSAYNLFWENLPPAIQNNRDAQVLRNQMEKEYEGRRKRSAEFERLLAEIDLGGPLGAEMDTHINTLHELAGTDEQRQALEKLERQVERARDSRADTRNQAFLDKLELWNSRIDEWNDLPASENSGEELAGLQESIAQVVAENQGIVDGRAAVSPDILQQAQLFLRRLEQISRQREEMALAARSLKELTRRVGNPEDFSSALENFASQFRTDPLAADFQRVAAEKRFWKALESWRQLAADRRWSRLETLPPGEAQELSVKLKSLAGDKVALQIPGDVDAVLAYLESVMERSAIPPERLAAQIRSFCRQDTFRFQQVLMDRDGNYYYLAEPAREDGEDVIVRYWTDIVDLETKFERFDPERVADFGTAGHCEISAALTEVDYRKFRTTAEYGLELLHTALAFESEGLPIDPVPRAIIVEYLLNAVVDSAPPLSESLKPAQEELGFLQINNIDWYNPDDNAADRKRQLLREQTFPDLLEQIGGLIENQQPANLDVDSLVAWTSLRNLAWAGWARRLDSGDWALVSPGPVEAGDVWMVVRTDENGGRLQKLGSCGEDGSLTVAEDAIEAVRSGHPVYMQKSPQDNP